MHGWLPKWVPDTRGFDPSIDLGVAHDILEHGYREDANFCHEIKAFGRIVYTRVMTGYFYEQSSSRRWLGLKTSTEQDLAHELMDLWMGSGGANHPCRPAPNTRPLEDEHAEQSCQAIAARFVAYRDELVNSESPYGEPVPSAESVASALSWLRIGYRDAERRYRSVGASVRSIFEDITSQVKQLSNHREEGDVMTIKVDLRRFMVTGRVEEAWERRYQ